MNNGKNKMTHVYIKDSNISEPGVFAGKYFSPGDRILQFTGPILNYKESHGSIEDYTVQIGPDKYLGPSGKVDDIVNHSCNPNAGLKKIDGEIWLVAIWWIFKDDEITFDYSTTIGPKEEWRMKCKCCAPDCRKIIGPFENLQDKIKDYYIKLGIALASEW